MIYSDGKGQNNTIMSCTSIVEMKFQYIKNKNHSDF